MKIRAVLILNGPQTGIGGLRKIEFCNPCVFCARCVQGITTSVLQKKVRPTVHYILRSVRWKLLNVP